MLVFAFFSVLVIIIVRLLNARSPPSLNGIYQHSSKFYYVKLIFIYIILLIRKMQNDIHVLTKKRSQHSGYGLKSKVSLEEMDMKQTLGSHPKAIDAVYFNLANSNGWHLIVGTASRPHDVVNGFLYLKVPDIGLLVSPKLPDTMLFRSKLDRENSYGAEGLILYPFQPMKVWKIQYNGPMHIYGDPENKFDVKLNAVWSSDLPYFDFDTDMNKYSVAKSMASEPWSREYFKNLNEFHQTHYEQHGDAHIQLHLQEKLYKVKVNGVRDHSYAEKREWKLFHRYALHFITLESGVRISVGIVCMPLAFTRLIVGYLYSQNGEIVSVHKCSLQLPQHGNNGNPPSDYGFSFEAGGHTYDVQVNVYDRTEFYIGWEWEARVVELLAQFTVNGVRGWGACEWQYRNVKGRPLQLLQSDPTWTKNINKG
ncbi:Uncharacterized protein GBIM_15186 [Gryllus bimaculatus]|nr:Uncharacterized protein GBIM_15186 [Gryllus bimaculatus]